MNKKISSYLSKIGAKGGKAGKGTPLRRKLARRAALKRWANATPRKRSAANVG